MDHLRPAIADRIRQDHPLLESEALISRAEADRYRSLYVEEVLKTERGELTELDRQVARSLEQNEILSQNVEQDYGEERTLGERLSDRLASFGGSWTFLITFFAVLLIWIAINVALAQRARSTRFPSSCSTWYSRALRPSRRRSSWWASNGRRPRIGCGRWTTIG
jgi:hypothetical protein